MGTVARIVEFVGAVVGTLWVLVNLVALVRSWRGSQDRTSPTKWLALAIILLPMGELTPLAEAAEARCTELGANCVCSEPLQMTGFTGFNDAFWNPSDSTDSKQCNGEGDGLGVGFTITRNGATLDLFGEGDATVLSRLPAGHSVSRYLRGPDDHQGTWFTGHTFSTSTQYAARLAMRFYTYQSDDFTLINQDNPTLGCNGKFMQFNNDLKIDQGYGDGNMYNWYEIGNVEQDCCFSGPSPAGGQYGKHWRMRVYRKNVTDNTPEVLWFDTDEPFTQANPGATPITPKYGLVSAFNTFLVNFYRQENVAGQCQGYRALSYVMVAGWDTDAGQRIGAASEVEGDGSGATALGNLTLLRRYLSILGVLEGATIAGFAWQARKQAIQQLLLRWVYVLKVAQQDARSYYLSILLYRGAWHYDRQSWLRLR
jgi:hypothetical protein